MSPIKSVLILLLAITTTSCNHSNNSSIQDITGNTLQAPQENNITPIYDYSTGNGFQTNATSVPEPSDIPGVVLGFFAVYKLRTYLKKTSQKIE